MTKVIVFGGAGFFGSNFAQKLLEQDYQVTLYDDFSTGKKKNIQPLLQNDKLKFIEGDIRDFAKVKEAMQNHDIAIQSAALIGSIRSSEKPMEVCSVNSLGMVHVLEAARLCDVNKLIHVSTSEVYASPPQYVPIDEKHPVAPFSIYASSLLAAENHCKAYRHLYGMKNTSVRYFTSYGPNQEFGKFGGAIVNFLHSILVKNEAPTIWGTGEQQRDFIYVEDAVNITLKAMQKDQFYGKILNCGSGQEISIKELAELILALSGRKDLKITYKEGKSGDVPRLLSDNTKLIEIVGPLQLTSLEEGITKFKEWMQQHIPKGASQ